MAQSNTAPEQVENAQTEAQPEKPARGRRADRAQMGKTIPLIVEDEAAEQEDGKGRRRRKGKKNKAGKKKRGVVGLIIIIALVIAAAVFLFLTIRFDIGGVRTKVIEAVNRFDPVYAEKVDVLEGLEEREQAVALREQQVEDDEQKISSQQDELKTWENELNSTSARKTPIYRRLLNEQDVKDMKSLSKTYAAMEPVDAAAIMVELYSVEDMAAIIYYMKEASAAAILVEMDTRLAADITMALLSS